MKIQYDGKPPQPSTLLGDIIVAAVLLALFIPLVIVLWRWALS